MSDLNIVSNYCRGPFKIRKPDNIKADDVWFYRDDSNGTLGVHVQVEVGRQVRFVIPRDQRRKPKGGTR